MKNTTFYQILEKISKKASLFESLQEANSFLKETVRKVMEKAGSTLGAVYIYNETTKELDFRVGYDRDDFWDTYRCGGKEAPRSFALDGNDVGKAFTEGAIRVLRYDDPSSPIRSKILIPIIRGPEKIGVLFIAHKSPDFFDTLNKADILGAASMLGDIFVEATALLEHKKTVKKVLEKKTPSDISGKKASEGIVLGTALPVWADLESVVEHLPPQGTLEEEEALFEKALTDSLRQLEQLQDFAASGEGDEDMVSLIFTAQLYMLKDPSFIDKMRDLIREGSSAAHAVKQVINEYADRFSAMKEVRLAEKAQDVRDLGFRMITNMGWTEESNFSYKGKIVISRHIYPSDLYRLAVEGVAGVVLRGTGVTAHIAILARSLSLPVLITDDRSLLDIPEGTAVLLDAGGGTLYINPSGEIIEGLLKTGNKNEARKAYTLKGMTADHVAVSVTANVNILKDAKEAVKQGAEGIGLYRSEFPFILKNDFLSEEQQYRIYRSIVRSQDGKSVVLRTADIGGDKLLQGRSEAEDNPFLGVRGIRFSLANRELFRDQLRAMMRAGADADLRILLPMVSGVEEVLKARSEIAYCRSQLENRGVRFNGEPKIGAMIELPSAAMAVEELASETDFLSIGSNDLTMYLLAVDRTNQNLSHLYRSHHPTVLRVLATIARESGDSLSELSVCGDTAADPLMIPFFVGLGIRKLSVSPANVERVKQLLNRFSVAQAEEISRKMLSIKRLGEMEEFIADFKNKYNV